MALTDNIISYWKMDGNSNDAADGNNGTDTAITYSLANGKINQGAGFNGSTSQISVGTGSNLNITGALTITAWINVSTFSQFNWITTRCTGNCTTANNWEYRINVTSGTQGFFGPGSGASSNTSVGTGAFAFVSVTRDASNNIAFYLNGSADGTGTAAAATSQSATCLIGTRNDNFTFFSGDIDEVGIWSRALSSSEISQLYNSGSGLQYPFGTTTIGRDGRNLTLLGVG